MQNKKLIASLAKTRAGATVIAFSKRNTLPGFDGLSIYKIVTNFINTLENTGITTRASSLAFNFILAIFPGLIFLFTLIAYVPIDNFQNELFLLLKQVLPHNAFEATKSTIAEILSQQRGDLLSFGFLLTTYFATNGIISMIGAFNTANYSKETRSPLTRRLIAIALFFVLSILVLVTVSLIIFSEIALNYLGELGILKDSLSVYFLLIGKWIIVLALLFFAFSLVYYFGPSKKSRFRFLSPGSTLATMLFIFTSLGFAYFVNNFGQYNKLYGSIGTLIVIMLWMYFNSLILLLGFELNVAVNAAKRE